MVDYKIPRCQIVPEADSQTSFTLDGMELFRWHYGGQYPRPFFHPVNGPSGANLVRMGHPGAPNHDHHAGIWFAHNSIESFDFWANGTETQIRQRQWLDYIDGDDYAAMAVILDYYDGHEDRPLLNQQTVVALRPLPNEEYLIEIQLELQSPQGVVNLNQTNYGIIAVRVGASIAEHFGGGRLTNSNGQVTEANIFGRPSAYMDYSGPVRGTNGVQLINGITLHDHKNNPSYPSKWHVREDGWMGPSINRDAPIQITQSEALRLRYQLHIHDKWLDRKEAEKIHREVNLSKPWSITKSTHKHRSWEINREV